MKSIKFIFAILFVSVFFTACTSDDIVEDQSLYNVDYTQVTGEDGSADVIRERD